MTAHDCPPHRPPDHQPHDDPAAGLATDEAALGAEMTGTEAADPTVDLTDAIRYEVEEQEMLALRHRSDSRTEGT